jgi:hypothetical protein
VDFLATLAPKDKRRAIPSDKRENPLPRDLAVITASTGVKLKQ